MRIAIALKPTLSLLAVWLLTTVATALSLPAGVILPSTALYAAFLMPPCLMAHVALGVLIAKRPGAWLGWAAIGVGLYVLVVAIQSRALLAFALRQDPNSALGGLLSNAFATAHEALPALLSGATVSLLALAWVMAQSPNYAFKRTAGRGFDVS